MNARPIERANDPHVLECLVSPVAVDSLVPRVVEPNKAATLTMDEVLALVNGSVSKTGEAVMPDQR